MKKRCLTGQNLVYKQSRVGGFKVNNYELETSRVIAVNKIFKLTWIINNNQMLSLRQLTDSYKMTSGYLVSNLYLYSA